MAKETSPLCFRLSAADRRLIEVVAAHVDLSVSDFVRTTDWPPLGEERRG